MSEGGRAPGAVILEGLDLEKTYDMGDRGLTVLRGVSIVVRAGEILAIQGPSGAGKSTLLHLLGLLDEPDTGVVRYRGEDIMAKGAGARARYRNEKIGFVFQFYHLFPDLSALENVCLPKMVGLSTLGYSAERGRIEARARELLDLVGLHERMHHRPSELSGGERQRVAIARALMNEPEVLLCDEPTGNLDQKTAGEILDLLWRLNEETDQTLVIVTHDETLARRAHRVIRMVDGAISDGGPPKPGFEETKFRLRDHPRVLAPSLAFALVLVPPLALVWSFLVARAFHRATRRGYSGTLTAVVQAIPLAGNLLCYHLFARPLAEANRILVANGEPGLRWVRLPVALFAVSWAVATVAELAIAPVLVSTGFHLDAALRANPAPFAVWAASFVGLAGLAAWIQSLHNAFYDRMSRS